MDVDREPELSKALVVLFLRIPLGGNILRESVEEEDELFETSDTDVSDIIDSVALVSSPPA